MDRLNIIAHDRFKEIVDAANRPDAPWHVATEYLNNDVLGGRNVTVVAQPRLSAMLGVQPAQPATETTVVAGQDISPAFTTPEEQKVARVAHDVIRALERDPDAVPTVAHLSRPEVREAIAKKVRERYRPAQLELEGIVPEPDVEAVVERVTTLAVEEMIGIPRIVLQPKSEVRSGFHPFMLDLAALDYSPIEEDLWIEYLRTHRHEELRLGPGSITEQRLEDYVVAGLVDFDDIAYDAHADLLYDLARQTVEHLCTRLTEEQARRVLQFRRSQIARFIHAQMQEHYWEDPVEYEVTITRGFTELRESAFTKDVAEPIAPYHAAPADKSNMMKYVFGGFARCLNTAVKFGSDAERRMAIILERSALKWFKPAKGQFRIYYRHGMEHPEYIPDFVAETDEAIYMLEPKMATQMEAPEVLAKRDAAVAWCAHATAYNAEHGDKPWRYALIPHDAIAENMTLQELVRRYGVG